MLFPNSSAMDATASSGGPITVLPQIVTGSPEQIAKHVGELLKKATTFTTLLDEFAKAAQQLEKVWSGKASESALKKIADSLASLNKIIGVVRKGAELLGISGTLVQAAQQAYRAVVSAVNPVVAGLMSNPWTYGAAVALSTATSASLRAFIQAIAALLKTLGVVDLANQVTQLATVISEIEKLFNGGKSGGDTPAAPGGSGIGSTPVTAPQAPPPVASASGQQVAGSAGGSGGGLPGNGSFTNYVPPALSGFTGNGSSLDSWIPVDRPVTLPAPATPAPGGGDDDIVIRTQRGDVVTSIEVPAGRDVELDLEFTVDGKQFEQHIDIDANGTVSVDR